MSSAKPSYSDGIQMVQMLLLLESTVNREMRINYIARRLEIHRRTVIRYVEALSLSVDNEFGEPIVRRFHRGREAWARLGRGVQPLSSHIFQFASVFAATRFLASGKGSVLSDGADDVLEVLVKGAEPGVRPMLRRVQSAFHYVAFGPKDYRANEDVLDRVVQAVIRGRPLTMRYRALRGPVAERTIEPYTLVLYRDGLYVLARRIDPAPPGMRLYAVDRMEEAQVDRKASFQVPPDFDPADHFAGVLGLWPSQDAPETLRVAFEPRVARLAREREWPGDPAWSTLDDGREVLTMKVPITPEVETWILTWGAEVEVLAPPSLRQRIAEQLRRALSHYDAGDQYRKGHAMK